MPTYIGLYKWTEQGVKDVKNTVNRAQQAKQALEQQGNQVTAYYWTQGPYDLITIADFPDETTAMAAMLTLAKAGNVETLTLRAFNAEEMQRILNKVP